MLCARNVSLAFFLPAESRFAFRFIECVQPGFANYCLSLGNGTHVTIPKPAICSNRGRFAISPCRNLHPAPVETSMGKCSSAGLAFSFHNRPSVNTLRLRHWKGDATAPGIIDAIPPVTGKLERLRLRATTHVYGASVGFKQNGIVREL